MKIYSMTATFGKLERQTLTLQPGLNIIEAPNEWGKSTWSAFLVAMLYGIDTKARTTQNTLADKERYAPWSGAPMEGRMDICWNGRDITIERRTRGRLIFGDFRAYETESGLDVPELTATNCGMELLGVERSVFVRAGFLKMADLPVTQDDALRRRLNNLVTTGDESGAGEKLAQSLKELKNKCRYNRTGLLPQAEAERDKLEDQLHLLQELNEQAERLQERQKALEQHIDALQNHKVALEYAKAQEDSKYIRQAIDQKDEIEVLLQQQKQLCETLPSAEETQLAQSRLQQLHQESIALQMEQQRLPEAPIKPEIPKCFEGLSPEKMVSQAEADTQQVAACGKTAKIWLGIMTAGATAVVAGIFLTWIASIAGAVVALLALLQNSNYRKRAKEIAAKYAPEPVENWQSMAQRTAQAQRDYENKMAQHQLITEGYANKRNILVEQLEKLTAGKPISDCISQWDGIAGQWKKLEQLQLNISQAESKIVSLQAMAKQLPAPTQPDELTYSLEETQTMLIDAAAERQQNNIRLGQYQGQAETLGQESALLAQRKQLRQRIEKLEETYRALELAQNALQAATSELQRRFAPRISKRAQELFEKLTHGRYQKLMLTEDLSVQVSTEDETILRSAQWRSDGTVDQLYLALRLAVAEELTPETPLVLDDAMVRFDDDRLKIALHILQEMAENKQVILFTCQGREKKLQGEA